MPSQHSPKGEKWKTCAPSNRLTSPIRKTKNKTKLLTTTKQLILSRRSSREWDIFLREERPESLPDRLHAALYVSLPGCWLLFVPQRWTSWLPWYQIPELHLGLSERLERGFKTEEDDLRWCTYRQTPANWHTRQFKLWTTEQTDSQTPEHIFHYANRRVCLCN